MDLYALILTSEHNKHGIFGLSEAFFNARFIPERSAQAFHWWLKKRGHTSELDTAIVGLQFSRAAWCLCEK